MRVSKPPEIRRQEMIDTAMRLFAKKGYEETSMTDIAKEMNVVSGLCYRYFKSKEELYHTALDQYASECAAPYIKIMNSDLNSFEEYCAKYNQLFLSSDGREKYHDFFHGDGNHMFHKRLEVCMLEKVQPHAITFLHKMKEQKIIQVEDSRTTALIMLYGSMPIINDDSLETKDKIRVITDFYKKILDLK